MTRRFSLSLMTAALLCLPAAAGATPARDLATTSDTSLATSVSRQVRQYAYYSIFDDVQGNVQNGVVTLTGKVTEPFKAKDIANRVKQVQGVREVNNQLQTLPASLFDQELRARIAANIYRDPLFTNYAIQPNPPIHIIVENGHVTLTGVVNSELDRRVAEATARNADFAFSVTNHLRLDSEVG